MRIVHCEALRKTLEIIHDIKNLALLEASVRRSNLLEYCKNLKVIDSNARRQHLAVQLKTLFAIYQHKYHSAQLLFVLEKMKTVSQLQQMKNSKLQLDIIKRRKKKRGIACQNKLLLFTNHLSCNGFELKCHPSGTCNLKRRKTLGLTSVY